MSLETTDLSGTSVAELIGEVAEPGGAPDTVNAVVRAFAANEAFRAAEWEELTTEDNPYRRPVRPDDLEWLDYAVPMPAANVLKLSALLGHRMLRNVYDTDQQFVAPTATGANTADRARFYSPRNRLLGALARPVLERHLFSVLDEVAGEPLSGKESVLADIAAYRERRRAEPPRFADAVRGTRGRRQAATFTLLQWSALRPATHAAAGRAALGEFPPALRTLLLDEYRGWTDTASGYRDLLAAAGLVPTVGAYWQLYLGSSLGRGNFLHHLGANQENLCALLGAVLHERIDRAAAAPHLAEVFADGLGYAGNLFAGDTDTADPAALATEILAPLQEVYGAVAVSEFHRGFRGARWFARLWDEDLATQVHWADRIEEYQEKAEKIDQHLTNENIEVDLDTFVETNEETSTTHVHDDHRLVMIEVGQMHFWNNVTHKIELNQGDKLLIPVSRLHGSTVLSGSCTYHQPIIPDDMLRQFI